MMNRVIGETPIVFLDLETTGFAPPGDRVIEISLRRKSPDGRTEVLDTLVAPGRPVAASHIHGITDSDLAGAPRFSDIVGDVLGLLEGGVVAAYNAAFDVRFLRAELRAAGVDIEVPYLCLMYLRPMLGIGGRCCLADACREGGVQLEQAHIAASDAEACEALFGVFAERFRAAGWRTFGDLARQAQYTFLDSLAIEANYAAGHPATPGGATLLSRAKRERVPAPIPGREALRTYADALNAVLADLVATPDEVAYVARLRRELGLRDEQVRALHARAFLSVVVNFTADDWLDAAETERLEQAAACLQQLGWGPMAEVGVGGTQGMWQTTGGS